MKRKITAWFLLMLMVVFTTMAHSGLRYCLCKKVVFLGKCECEQVGFSTQENDQPESNEQETCSCCVAHANVQLNDINDELNLPEIAPCSVSCVIDLTLQLDDFILTESDSLTSKSSDEIQLLSLRLRQNYELIEISLSPDIHAPRGSPPPFHRLSVPIYLRDSVYRI